MIPTFRTVILVGPPFTRAQQGPLRYSGFEVRHEEAERAAATVSRAVCFWFWVPEGKRDPWRGTSRVPDIQPHEAARLACGEIEEERHNAVFPSGLPLQVAGQWLNNLWKARCIQRLGFLPEQFQRASALDLTPGAQRVEQERNRIVL